MSGRMLPTALNANIGLPRPVIPFDVFENILSNFLSGAHVDSRMLSACSLVSSWLRGVSQKLLFSQISLEDDTMMDYPRFQALVGVLKTSTQPLASYVRALHLGSACKWKMGDPKNFVPDECDKDTWIIELFDLLPNLQTLSFGSTITHWCSLTLGARTAIRKRYDGKSTGQLEALHIRSLIGLPIDLLFLSPKLKHLSIETLCLFDKYELAKARSTVKDSPNAGSALWECPVRLESFCAKGTYSVQDEMLCLAPVVFSELKVLRLQVTYAEKQQIPHTTALLNTCAYTLQTLEIEWADSTLSNNVINDLRGLPNLRPLKNLANLHLTIAYDSRNPQDRPRHRIALALLAESFATLDIQCPLRAVNIYLDSLYFPVDTKSPTRYLEESLGFFNNYMSRYAPEDWGIFDKSLSAFPSLRTINVYFCLDRRVCEAGEGRIRQWKRDIKSQLPDLSTLLPLSLNESGRGTLWSYGVIGR